MLKWLIKQYGVELIIGRHLLAVKSAFSERKSFKRRLKHQVASLRRLQWAPKVSTKESGTNEGGAGAPNLQIT